MVSIVEGDTLEGGVSFLALGVGSHLSGWSDHGDPALDLHSHPPKVSFNLSSITPDDATFSGRPSSLSRPITAIAWESNNSSTDILHSPLGVGSSNALPFSCCLQ
jgi:hypothetical protein